jgi:hypothetical protein
MEAIFAVILAFNDQVTTTTTVLMLEPNSLLSKVSVLEPISNFERSEILASLSESKRACTGTARLDV